MKERAKGLRAAARAARRAAKQDGESDVLAKIAEMADWDRAMAERIHAVVKAGALLEPGPCTPAGAPVATSVRGARSVSQRLVT
jgi:hypothetical protein